MDGGEYKTIHCRQAVVCVSLGDKGVLHPSPVHVYPMVKVYMTDIFLLS